MSMKRETTTFARTIALCGAVVCAAGAARADELPVPVQVERLDNGLRVVMSPEHSAPTVAVAVYYDVGSRVEERGRSGFAHLFEHMMFEGSANVGKGDHFRLISNHGGRFNGTTSDDRTNYFETLPANALELGLFLEADRMRSLSITWENFENQRQTVMEERRQSYENRPYALSSLRANELAFQGYFPYEHSTIGDMADLRMEGVADAEQLQRVREFHDRYYAPDNAVISIAGDFEPAQAMELVRRHFGQIAARHAPAWQDPGFQPQTAERVDSMQDPHAQLPAFHVQYHIPPRRTPDHYPLEVFATILGGGESSRLYQELVKQREIAAAISVGTDDRRGPDLFSFWCVLAQNHTGQEAREVIYRQIEQVARQGVTARELDKARNQIRAQFVFGLQNNLHRAMRLAEYELYDGNAALLRTELDRYLAVTAADIQRVAGQYFTAANRTVLDVMPVARSAQEVTPGTAPAPTRPATPSTPTPARPPAPTAPAPTRPTTSNTPSAPPRPAAPAH
jgi:predicted Zn-dependent peptidase